MSIEILYLMCLITVQGVMMVIFLPYKLNALRKQRDLEINKILEQHLEEVMRVQNRYAFLDSCDWMYARKYNTSLSGLPMLIPNGVMRSIDKIDVTRYLTSDELEVLQEGLLVYGQDGRTKTLSEDFIIK